MRYRVRAARSSVRGSTTMLGSTRPAGEEVGAGRMEEETMKGEGGNSEPILAKSQ